MSKYLTIEDVCDELGISRSTWDKWRAKRVAPTTVRLPNGTLRVRPADLEAWIESCVR